MPISSSPAPRLDSWDDKTEKIYRGAIHGVAQQEQALGSDSGVVEIDPSMREARYCIPPSDFADEDAFDDDADTSPGMAAFGHGLEVGDGSEMVDADVSQVTQAVSVDAAAAFFGEGEGEDERYFDLSDPRLADDGPDNGGSGAGKVEFDLASNEFDDLA